jgi:hypothetical protein
MLSSKPAAQDSSTFETRNWRLADGTGETSLVNAGDALAFTPTQITWVSGSGVGQL